MNARLVPAPRDPIGRRDPAAVEMVGLGFASVAREPVAVVTVLIAELLAGLALFILTSIAAGDAVGTATSRGFDRILIVLSPVLSVTGPFREQAGPDGVPTWAIQSPFAAWVAVGVLFTGTVSLLVAVGLMLIGRSTPGADSGSPLPAHWPTMIWRMMTGMVQATGITLLLGAPLVLAAWVADRANHSDWMAPTVIAGVVIMAWWAFRFVADAIVQDGRSATGAVIASVRIVMRFPGVAFRLFVLSESILLGCRALWVGLIGSPIGLFVALVGNAAVFLAVIAGRTTFYREARDILAAEQADVCDSDPLSPGIIAART